MVRAFIKKTEKTPTNEIDLHQRAQQRRGGQVLLDHQVLCRVKKCAVFQARKHACVGGHTHL